MNPNDKSKIPEWLAKKYSEKPGTHSHAKTSHAKPCESKSVGDKKISLVKYDQSTKQNR